MDTNARESGDPSPAPNLHLSASICVAGVLFVFIRVHSRLIFGFMGRAGFI
jgi:hypothetical protein